MILAKRIGHAAKHRGPDWGEGRKGKLHIDSSLKPDNRIG